jgi:hypothetical protein
VTFYLEGFDGRLLGGVGWISDKSDLPEHMSAEVVDSVDRSMAREDRLKAKEAAEKSAKYEAIAEINPLRPDPRHEFGEAMSNYLAASEIDDRVQDYRDAERDRKVISGELVAPERRKELIAKLELQVSREQQADRWAKYTAEEKSFMKDYVKAGLARVFQAGKRS